MLEDLKSFDVNKVIWMLGSPWCNVVYQQTIGEEQYIFHSYLFVNICIACRSVCLFWNCSKSCFSQTFDVNIINYKFKITIKELAISKKCLKKEKNIKVNTLPRYLAYTLSKIHITGSTVGKKYNT